MLCRLFIPTLKFDVILPPHTKLPCTRSLLKSDHAREKKHSNKQYYGKKCKQFAHLDYKSLKYIAGPGKNNALDYLQFKITNNNHAHFAIFNNLLYKAFLVKEAL